MEIAPDGARQRSAEANDTDFLESGAAMRESTALRRCTAERQNREFCDGPSLPDMPFPICLQHLAQLMNTVRYMLDEKIAEADPAANRDGLRLLIEQSRHVDMASRWSDGLSEKMAIRRDEEREHVVYYLRLGEHVKIGYTSDLVQRMASYPPMAHLVAIEPGDRSIEASRHTQFRRHLDGGREWFTLCPELTAHITMLRRMYGEPPATCRAA